MKKLQLRHSEKVALLDDVDYHRLKHFKWYFIKKSGYVYRAEWVPELQRNRTIYLHKDVLRVPREMEVDHKNGIKLDCTKKNLRKSTSSQNKANSHAPIRTSTGFKGVLYYPHNGGEYLAYVKKNSKMIYLGRYASAMEAAKVRDEKAFELFGEFARLNFPIRRFPRLADGIAA